MSLANIGYIDPVTKAVVSVDLVNDGDRAGEILARHYNTFNSAKLLVEQGVISILKPQLQDCITHAMWGREKRVNRGTADLLWIATHYASLQGDNIEDSPFYIFDTVSFMNDYEKYNEWYYHTQYGKIDGIDSDTSYWLMVDRDGIHKVKKSAPEPNLTPEELELRLQISQAQASFYTGYYPEKPLTLKK